MPDNENTETDVETEQPAKVTKETVERTTAEPMAPPADED